MTIRGRHFRFWNLVDGLGASFVPLMWRFVQKEQSLNPPALDPIGCLISAADKKTPASEGSGLFSRQLPCEATLQLSCPFAGKVTLDQTKTVLEALADIWVASIAAAIAHGKPWNATGLVHVSFEVWLLILISVACHFSLALGCKASIYPEIDLPEARQPLRASDRDLVRGGHYGQRPRVPHLKAEHMAAPTKTAKREESSPTPSRPHMAQSGHPGCSREIKKLKTALSGPGRI